MEAWRSNAEFSASRSTIAAMRCRMVECLRHRVARAVGADQLVDPVLRLAKLAVTPLQERHPLLVTAQRILQAGLAVLQLADNAFQLGEGLLESLRFLGLAHG